MFQPLSASVFMYWRVITFNILLNSFGIQPGQPGQLMVDTGSWCPTNIWRGRLRPWFARCTLHGTAELLFSNIRLNIEVVVKGITKQSQTVHSLHVVITAYFGLPHSQGHPVSEWFSSTGQDFRTLNMTCFGCFSLSLHWLVVSTPPKNMKVSWHYYSQYMEK